MNRHLPEIIGSALALLLVSGIAQAGTYVNQKFGFSLDYPENYALRTSSDHYFSIRDNKGRTILDGEIESLSSYPQGFYGSIEDPLRDFGIHRATLRCDADGPDGSAYCPSVQSVREFRTEHGIRAIELHLNHVQEIYGENPETLKSVVGPVYLLDISSEEQTAVLLIGVAPYLQMSAEQRSLAEDITSALKRLGR